MKKWLLVLLILVVLNFGSAVTLDKVSLNSTDTNISISVETDISMRVLYITNETSYFNDTYLDYWIYNETHDTYEYQPSDERENITFSTINIFHRIFRMERNYQFALFFSFLGPGLWFLLWGSKLDSEHIALKILFTAFALILFVATVYVVDALVSPDLGGYYGALVYGFSLILFIVFILFVKKSFQKLLTPS